MAWSSNFKAKRMSELNRMKIIDRMNPTMTSEYYGVINGVVDPKRTHYFSGLAETHDARKFSKENGFMQTRMTSLNPSPMVNREGVIKEHDSPIIGNVKDDSDIDFPDTSPVSSNKKSFRGYEARATMPRISLSSLIGKKFRDSMGSFE